jgi:hypothetical protein
MQNLHVTLIGEPTGVPFNFASDAKEFTFPASGLYQTVGYLRAQLGESDDISDSVPVSVPAPLSFADYMAGRDSAVDPILSGVEMRSLPLIALSDGGIAARRVYEARKSLHAQYSWWHGERFIDIKRAGYELLRSGRGPDSVELFRINSERFPDDWMSWENLGRGQVGAGKIDDARQSYQCALALDAENFDRGDLVSAINEGGGSARIDVAPGCPVSRHP